MRDWAQGRLVGTIVAVESLRGGLTDTMYAVHTSHGGPFILRYVDISRWGETGRQHVISEALGCRLMESSSLPTPRSIASETEGSGAGAYVGLTSWLPGQVRFDPLGSHAINALAEAAVVVHSTGVDAATRPRPFDFWVPPHAEVPGWSSRPDLWHRAISFFDAGPPPTPAVLLHRDFHLGNVLWEGDVLTGMIDWAETSWGPADLDVAHAVTNFMMLHDQHSAEAFAQSYRDHGGVLTDDPESSRFWQVSDILGFLPDPAVQLRAIIAAHPGFRADQIRLRLEGFLEQTLEGRLA